MATGVHLGHCCAFSLPDERLFWHRHGHVRHFVHWQRLCTDGAARSSLGPAVPNPPATQHGMWPSRCRLIKANRTRRAAACHSRSGLQLDTFLWLQVLLYFLIIVSVLGLFAVLTAPDIIREASDFVTRLKSDNVWTVVLEKMRHGLG